MTDDFEKILLLNDFFVQLKKTLFTRFCQFFKKYSFYKQTAIFKNEEIPFSFLKKLFSTEYISNQFYKVNKLPEIL